MSRKLLFVLGIAAVVVVFLQFSKNAMQAEEAVRSKQKHYKSTFHFTKGWGRVYDVVYHNQVVFSPNISATDQMIDLKAIMNVRVFEVHPSYSIVGLELSKCTIGFGNPTLERAFEKLYSTLVLLKISKDGSFKSYSTPEDKKEIKGVLRLYDMLQVILADKEEYRLEENNTIGKCRVHYKRESDTILRSKEEYLRINESGHDYVVKKSKFNISLEENGWINSLRGHENIAAKEGSRHIFNSMTRVSFVKREDAPDGSLQIWREQRSVTEMMQSYKRIPAPTAKNALMEEARRDAYRSYIQKQHVTFGSLLDKIKESNKFQHYIELKKYLEVYPEKIEKIAAIVVVESDPSLSAGLIHVLELLDTPKNIALLRQLYRNEQLSFLNKERVIVALGGVQHPDRQSIDLLIHIAEKRDDMDSSRLSSSAVFALSALRQNVDSETKNLIDESLSDWANEPDDKELRRIAFKAELESNASAHFDEIVEKLETQDMAIKSLALYGLGRIQSDASKEKIRQVITKAESPGITAEAIEALSLQEADEETVSQMIKISEHTKYAKVSDAALRYLCKTSKYFPKNKPYLKKQLPKQKNISIVKMIIRVVR